MSKVIGCCLAVASCCYHASAVFVTPLESLVCYRSVVDCCRIDACLVPCRFVVASLFTEKLCSFR